MISLSDPCCIGSLKQCWDKMMGRFVACGSSLMCFLLPGSPVEEPTGSDPSMLPCLLPCPCYSPTCNKRDPHEPSKLSPHMPQASSFYPNLQLSSNIPTETSFQMPQELWRVYIYKCLRVPSVPKNFNASKCPKASSPYKETKLQDVTKLSRFPMNANSIQSKMAPSHW